MLHALVYTTLLVASLFKTQINWTTAHCTRIEISPSSRKSHKIYPLFTLHAEITEVHSNVPPIRFCLFGLTPMSTFGIKDVGWMQRPRTQASPASVVTYRAVIDHAHGSIGTAKISTPQLSRAIVDSTTCFSISSNFVWRSIFLADGSLSNDSINW